MLVSILHRATGDGMALVALPVLLWWLSAIARGPAAYESFSAIATTWYGYLVLVGISWAFFNHLSSGIRHFVLDIGAGYEVEVNNRWSVVTTASGVILTAAFWAALVLL
jgi:succinate dehydrogenase / fumarate reductase cytochrome b subunit